MTVSAFVQVFGRRVRVAVALCLSMSPLGPSGAQSRPQAAMQTVFQRALGAEARYRGDTIWRERDSTLSRTVFRGDTVERTSYLHGKSTGSLTYVVHGDNAMLIASTDSAGRVRAGLPAMRPTPASIALGERMLLEQALRAQAMEAQLAGITAYQRAEAPMLPQTTQSYPFSANRQIEVHVDTVRYISGCAAAPPIDTTTYLLFGTDSLRRISPAPRTFGRMMVAAVNADITMSLTRRNMAARDPDFSALPGPPRWPCDKR